MLASNPIFGIVTYPERFHSNTARRKLPIPHLEHLSDATEHTPLVDLYSVPSLVLRKRTTQLKTTSILVLNLRLQHLDSRWSLRGAVFAPVRPRNCRGGDAPPLPGGVPGLAGNVMDKLWVEVGKQQGGSARITD